MPWWIDRTRRLRRHVSRLEAWEVERFGRSGLSVVSRQSVGVLTTTGRRTGAARKTPVACMPYEGGYLIGGGAGGQKATPDWVHNLGTNPQAELTIHRRTRAVSVEELTGQARRRAFDAMVACHPGARRYEAWSGRPLPLFVLRPSH